DQPRTFVTPANSSRPVPARAAGGRPRTTARPSSGGRGGRECNAGGGAAAAESGPDPDGQPRGVDARLLREPRRPHAAHRPPRGRGRAVHPRAGQQPRLLAHPGHPPDRAAPVPARRSQLPDEREERRADGAQRPQHDPRVRHAAQDPPRRRVRLRPQRQVAPRRQPAPAGGLHALGHDAARAYDGVLRRRRDRGRQGPAGADVPDRPVDRARGPVHRAEPRAAVLPLPGVQRAVRAGADAAEPGPQPARGVLRRPAAAQLPAGRDAPVAEREQGVPERHRGDPPDGRGDQRGRRRGRGRDGRFAEAGVGREHARGVHGRPGVDGRAERDLGHGRPHPAGRRVRPDDAGPADRPPPGQGRRRRDERPAGQQLRPDAHAAVVPGPGRPHGRGQAQVARPGRLAGAVRQGGRRAGGRRGVLRDGGHPGRPHGRLEVRGPPAGRPVRAVRPAGRPARAVQPVRPAAAPAGAGGPGPATGRVLPAVRRPAVRSVERRPVQGQAAREGGRL
ncbi:MAG: Arylsulfatase, partial [uncultured Phycisphaerae bacterium]